MFINLRRNDEAHTVWIYFATTQTWGLEAIISASWEKHNHLVRLFDLSVTIFQYHNRVCVIVQMQKEQITPADWFMKGYKRLVMIILQLIRVAAHFSLLVTIRIIPGLVLIWQYYQTT
jgi:hypothetical protein